MLSQLGHDLTDCLSFTCPWRSIDKVAELRIIGRGYRVNGFLLFIVEIRVEPLLGEIGRW